MTGVDGDGGNSSPVREPAVALTARGAGALAAFCALVALSVATGSLGLVSLLVGVGVVLLAAAGAAWWRGGRALGPPPVRVHLRAVPATVAVGGTCTLEVAVAGPPGRRLPPLSVERPDERWRLTHRLPSAGPLAAPPTTPGRRWRVDRLVAPTPGSLLALPRGRTDSVEGAPLGGPVWTGQRGVLQLPALGVWALDPFGLFGAAVTATAPLVVVVHPRPLPTAVARPSPSAGSASSAGATLAAPSPGAGWGDFSDLRPYVAGDRLHLIDWPALARYDRLLVRRFDPEAGAAVQLVLDDRAGVHRRADFERLLATLVGMVAAAVADGHPVEVSTLSGRSFPVPPTSEGLAAFLPVSATFAPCRTPSGSAVRSVGAALLTTATGADRLPPGPSGAAEVVVA